MCAGGSAMVTVLNLVSPPATVRTSLPVRRSTRTTETFPESAGGVRSDDVAPSAAKMGEAASMANPKQQIYPFFFRRGAPLFSRQCIGTIFSWTPRRDSFLAEAVARSRDVTDC